MSTNLTDFDGLPVRQASLSLTGAGDGLSEAMKTAPRELHHGETIYIVYEAQVVKVRHDQIDKDDPDMGLVRVHMAKAATATIVDEAFAGEVITAQKLANEKARDEAAGVLRLPETVSEYGDGFDDGLPETFDVDADPDTIPAADDETGAG